MGTFGSTPNANGAIITGATLTLQPADVTHPGSISTATQTIGGAKDLQGQVTFSDGGSSTAANLAITGGSTVTQGITASQLLFGSATTVAARLWERGQNATTLTNNISYASHILGRQTVTEGTSGTHETIAQMVILPVTINNGSATTTNNANLYIPNAPSGGSNNYSLWVGGGITKLDGGVTLTGLSTDNTATQVLGKDGSGNSVWRDASSIGGGSPGGSNTNIQFNNSGAFGGSGNFVYNTATGRLSLDAGSATNEGISIARNTSTTNYSFLKMVSNQAGFIDIGDAVSTGFDPYIILKPDGTDGNTSFIEARATDAGSGAALNLQMTNLAGSGALSTKPLLDVTNFGTSKFKIEASGNVGIGLAGTAATSILQTTSFAVGYISKAIDYTATATDHTIEITATGKTITLPTAVGISGRIYTVKLTAATSSGTVATTSSQTIDGSTTYSLSAQYKYVTVQSNGANWLIIANN